MASLLVLDTGWVADRTHLPGGRGGGQSDKKPKLKNRAEAWTLRDFRLPRARMLVVPVFRAEQARSSTMRTYRLRLAIPAPNG
jgi:hypothetical protein